MPSIHQPLFPDSFLASRWAPEYASFRGSAAERELISRLRDWSSRKVQKETTAESAFIGAFFKQTWGYQAAGESTGEAGHTCEPQYAIAHAGQQGGTGAADLALGYFDRAGIASTPQVVCEFKDVRSGLDKPQNRKGNDRSPVKQCADYLREAANKLYGNEAIQPAWGVVSDMNEFRLYWRKKMPSQYQRFVIKAVAADGHPGLLDDNDDAAFQRFVFWKIFQRDVLLTTGGPSPLERLLTEQWVQERKLEGDFYAHYQAYRQEVFEALVDANPNFKGSKGKLVRLTQRFLDRCIFILFCEDMGPALNFPAAILRDLLVGLSTDPDYDPKDDVAWLRIKKLFSSMRDGSPFREHRINRFNGGLFAEEPELESLHIPTRLFCAKGQGSDQALLALHEKTLLFFSASYNFGIATGSGERSVGLYTLGRIFEQSITELEFMEAKAEGRASISELSKRKRDGVYYTPEWITSYIVEETVGATLTEIRRRLGLDPLPSFDEEALIHYRRARASGKKDRRFNTERVEQYVAALNHYANELANIKVVDPACGSGAFLIQALDRLVNERRWLSAENERVLGDSTLFDTDAVTKDVLSRNIYGVDINEESIEITRLALWLHTALPDRPLSSLDHNIRCGNSLVGSDFYSSGQTDLFNEAQRERVNAFDWPTAFPEVFDRPAGKAGFDCVVGNPPYVKLQHFRQVLPGVADYLLDAKRSNGNTPLYESTQTKNFDMYLPFVERGIELLNQDGRMGYIAPSVWLLNEYGEGLRTKLLETQRLERWLDFKDFPIFDEAMTYTALQFYAGKPKESIACVFAPTGEIAGVDWSEPDAVMPYSELDPQAPWVFARPEERALRSRLDRSCVSLGDHDYALGIFQGLITSSDSIYHLERLAPGRYRSFAKSKEGDEVEIEDAIMRPLVSGAEAKRYVSPATATYILFPYDDSARPPRLLGFEGLKSRFPLAAAYLRDHEHSLRKREHGAFNDDEWHRFGRNQSLDKQKLPKLGIAQTAPEIRAFFDTAGSYCFNNVRVNGIVPTDEAAGFFLMGILNSRVADFVFRRISKPKEPRPSGAYFEANKQYIAPLPIPRVDDAAKERVVAMARDLQTLHTARRDKIAAIDQRLASEQMVAAPRPPTWLWADVGDGASWSKQNKTGLKGRELKLWAKQQVAEKLAAHLAEMSEAFSFGATMCASEQGGELRFYVRDQCVIRGIYVDERDAALILAQWRQKARDAFVSDTVNAARVVDWLLDLKTTENAALVNQIRKLNNELVDVEEQIRSRERQLDDLAYELYDLTEAERLMVEADTRPRWDARIPRPPA